MRNTLAVVPPELSNRVVVLLSDAMLKRLDEWRWENRVSSRGEAIRRMIEAAPTAPPSIAEIIRAAAAAAAEEVAAEPPRDEDPTFHQRWAEGAKRVLALPDHELTTLFDWLVEDLMARGDKKKRK